ncbi:MAG: UDP-N-acetylglucosamine 2-epimerase (non-hydrolyzing) [Syntrophus sp. SKADARSKE-3]|nr:UDP-N-acetylglucosamine 2-epimerase (non-hydrolyzing) [Syntrophus sp. SKADARSKE-3]
MKKVLTILGTRPEAIKLAPVIKELENRSHYFESAVLATGQHDELLDQMLDVFHIQPDHNLRIMQNHQTLTDLTARLLPGIEKMIMKFRPHVILVQGDTTTVFAASLAAFYNRIEIGHVEAGLRTNDKYQPFPEEINRRLTDQMADYAFAPTEEARKNLLKSGIPAGRIFVTGNTVIDALKLVSKADQREKLDGLPPLRKHMILITAHRRENFGTPLMNVFLAVKKLAKEMTDTSFVYPVHPNPQVFGMAHEMLSGIPNVHLIEPVGYIDFVWLMRRSHIILTDSGGIQEEAPSLHKPVLILRNKTERPEAVKAGGAKLVGTSPIKIIRETRRLMTNIDHYNCMAYISNPFGDGTAAARIADILEGRSCPKT